MKKSFLSILPLIMLTLVGCSSTRATTAEEFVIKHSRSHHSRDARAVAEMILCTEDLEKTTLPTNLKLELADFKRDSMVKRLEQDMKGDGVWSHAWEDTKYVSEMDRGDYIQVEVKVGYTYSNIVLVRVGKYLKIAPNPSSFE